MNDNCKIGIPEISTEHIYSDNTATPTRRGRGRKNHIFANEFDSSPKPCILKVNPYVVSPQSALDLMAEICSAEPSAKRNSLIAEIKDIFANSNFINLIRDNRPLFHNPTLDKDLFNMLNKLVFAMDNEAFGNRPRVRIAVAGLFSAGKSSLLNHLMQQPNLLPENPNPSTVVPAYLYCRKDINENHIYGVNQYNALVQLNDAAINGIEHKFEVGKEGAIQKGASEQIASALHHFIVEIPHDDFDKMVFIDTPGFGNAGSRDNRIANDCIRSADMLVYLADCNNGSLKDDELKMLNDFYEINKGPIIVVITRNDLKTKEGAKSIFDQISSQVTTNSSIKDVICMSVRSEDNYWSTSGLSLKESMQMVSQEAKCTTDIDKYWENIVELFELEKKHIDVQKVKLEKTRADIINSKIELQKNIDYRLKSIPLNIEDAIKSNSILNEEKVGERLKILTDYYSLKTEEDLNRHQRIIDVYNEEIQKCSAIQDILKKTLDDLKLWEYDTIRNLQPIQYNEDISEQNYLVFDAIKDLSDFNLNKLINSLTGGFDVTTQYNEDGYSVLTFAAYCGNIPALFFMLNRISKRYIFMRDRNGRNIIHAAAEGMQFNTLMILKEYYPQLISIKNNEDKTYDEIIRDNLQLKTTSL